MTHGTNQARRRTKTALSDLRSEAGYRNAKEFAEAIGVPASTYSRWERGGEGPVPPIPTAAAWAIADKLGTTIDAVVGRTSEPEGDGMDLNAFYRSLSEGSQGLLDEIVKWLDFRERVLATEGR
ncbi:MAG: helix-turn-helix transcriptional regulator [Atopobiaceae bacterium]|nr:helix-turn-helix transcriptional regulator [Atopobiaceae bacterium]